MGKKDQGVSASDGRYQAVPRTLCFITHGEDVLLLKGAPDKRIWANRYNGLGGHVERDEDVCTAALREICEETGWRADDVQNLRLRGLVNVDAGDAQTGIMLFVFTARARQRQTRASAEGVLEWIPRSRLLGYDLVEDLPVLLPRLLSLADDAPPFFAHYSYDQDDRLVVRFNTATCQISASKL
jgi:8-oxo-dGTP diphosphatase